MVRYDLLVLMHSAWSQGEADGGNAAAEDNIRCQGDDGIVILHGVAVKVGMFHKGDRQDSDKYISMNSTQGIN